MFSQVCVKNNILSTGGGVSQNVMGREGVYPGRCLLGWGLPRQVSVKGLSAGGCLPGGVHPRTQKQTHLLPKMTTEAGGTPPSVMHSCCLKLITES